MNLPFVSTQLNWFYLTALPLCGGDLEEDYFDACHIPDLFSCFAEMLCDPRFAQTTIESHSYRYHITKLACVAGTQQSKEVLN